MLLATATPVQLDPIEAFDFLHALNGETDAVLGNPFSLWITQPRQGLSYVLGHADPPTDVDEVWQWMRNPLPPADEDKDFKIIRDALRKPASSSRRVSGGSSIGFGLPDRARVERLGETFFRDHNPYIRHIIRRTREYLENEIDPETHEPYLNPVRVRLFGEDASASIPLPTFLKDAYDAAEQFCEEVGRRPGLNSGFLKTILLRRIGSSIVAGRRTAEKMLGANSDPGDEDDEEEHPRSVTSSAHGS